MAAGSACPTCGKSSHVWSHQDHHSALSSLDVFRHGSIDGDAKGPQRKVGRRRRQVVGRDFLVRAAALAMHRRNFNASFDGDAIVQHGVNVGIAISFPKTKVTQWWVSFAMPIARAHDLGRVKALAEKAHSRSRPEDMEGATFTISIWGCTGSIILLPSSIHPTARSCRWRSPQAAGGAGRFHRSWPSYDRNVVKRPPGHRRRMAARWLQTVRESVEHPTLLLV